MRDEGQQKKTGADEAGWSESLERFPIAMVLTDPRIEDNPIVYVNSAFETVTYYSKAFAIGRNCRFLQGEETDKDTVKKIGAALSKGEEVSVDILNYRADHSKFMNRLVIAPIKDEDGEITAFIGIQKETPQDSTEVAPAGGATPDDMLRELQHRVKNHLAMIVSMIRMQARHDVTAESFQALSHRVQSLALLYEELSPVGVSSLNTELVPAGAYLSRVSNTLGAIDGRSSVRINIECEEIELPVDLSAKLGLLLTEFLTNALEHAFPDGRDGVVRIRFQRQTHNGIRLVVEDDGVGLPADSTWPEGNEMIGGKNAKPADIIAEAENPDAKRKSGFGGSIIKSLARSINGQVHVASTRAGTVAMLDVIFDDEAVDGAETPEA